MNILNKIFLLVKNNKDLDKNIKSFNDAIKILKKIINQNEFIKAKKWILELKNKEINWFNWLIQSADSKVIINAYKKELERRLNILKKLEKKLLDEEKKYIFKESLIEIKDWRDHIKFLMKKNDFENVIIEIDSLKKKFLWTDDRFSFLDKYFDKELKTIEKYKKLAYTKDIKNFDMLIKKINSLISLKEFDKAEKWIKEVEVIEKNNFESLKNDMSISRRKIKKAEKKYNYRMQTFNKLLKKISYERIKKINYDRELDRKKILLSVKNDLKSLESSLSFEKWVSLLEKKIDENKSDLLIVWEFNRLKNLFIKKSKNKKYQLELNKNAKEEAEKLVWEPISEVIEIENENITFFNELKKNILDFINKIKLFLNKSAYNKVVSDLNALMSETSYVDKKQLLVKSSMFHQWLNKILDWVDINWYDFYWKILWADKITWDTFSFKEKHDRYWFSFWDATGHWVKAWFIVSLFTKNFLNFIDDYDNLKYFVMFLNNKLKEGLKSGTFITGIFFEIEKNNTNKLNLIWMGHEPIYVYKFKEKEVYEERIWWLAWWMVSIKDVDKLKQVSLDMEDRDIVLSFTDWISEAKNSKWEMYTMERLKSTFNDAVKVTLELPEIYNYIFNDLKTFTWKSNFDDDVTLILLKKSSKKDILSENEIWNMIKDIWLPMWVKVQLKWKSREEINEKIIEIKKQRELKSILVQLDTLYKTWELLKLKEESIRFIKLWYIHKKINFYLKKALDWEFQYKIRKKNEKLMSKYKLLEWLYDRWDYKVVLKEASDVILKNWNI